jgi:hypothetical protein
MIGMSGYYCLRPPRVDALNAKEAELHTDRIRDEKCRVKRDAPPMVFCKIILSVGVVN